MSLAGGGDLATASSSPLTTSRKREPSRVPRRRLVADGDADDGGARLAPDAALSDALGRLLREGDAVVVGAIVSLTAAPPLLRAERRRVGAVTGVQTCALPIWRRVGAVELMALRSETCDSATE